MRLIHTSDWHIGRVWAGVDLLDTQREFGLWLCDLVREEGIEAILVAGDIYDRAVPSSDAVAVADEIFAGLAAAGAIIIAISGNHDSADRLSFGSRFMAGAGLHIRTERRDLEALGEPVVIRPLSGESLQVVCLPFLEPTRVDLPEDQSERTHENVLRLALSHQREKLIDPGRSIVMAHAFVGGGTTSLSERDLIAVGGTSVVSHELFDDFGYVALGHLHRPQQIGSRGSVIYSGSPIPYSFSEQHEKSLVILDSADMSFVRVPVGVGRGVESITGTLSEILTSAKFKSAETKFVRVELTDAQVQVGAMDRVRERFPHALELNQSAIFKDGSSIGTTEAKVRSTSDEVEAYMQQYFEGDSHVTKHELARRAVHHVVTSSEEDA